MVAYLFWHFPFETALLELYEGSLVRFHHALSAARIDGFIASASMRVSELPWVPRRHAYEDWYVLRDSSALDRINEAAVRAHAKESHDELAAAAQWGAGGLYRHRLGQLDFTCGHACWFSKPESLTYLQVDELLRGCLSAAASLWQRQMTLGPGTEYCALAPEAIALPSVFPAHSCLRNALRPSGGHGI